MQFASGDPPLLVKQKDLMPEVSEDDAHTAISSVTSCFIANTVAGKSCTIDQNYVNDTQTLLSPLIKAFE